MATSALAAGLVVADRYRIERKLATGGMGEVYLAEHVGLGRRVAVKILRPEVAADEAQVARFRREARAAAAVGHDAIVDILDVGVLADGAPFLVMEWLDGESLRARVDRTHWLSVAEASRVGVTVLDAVAAVHAQGIVHRDLKPDNVFLVERPAPGVKVLDFGVSRIVDDATLSRTGEVMGTPLYMAPEQARGEKDVGPPADLYAVGALLFHTLAGAPPFLGKNLVEVLSRVMSAPPPRLVTLRPDVPAPLDALVNELLAKAPAARPSAKEAAARLRAIAAAAVSSDVPAPPVATNRQPRAADAATRPAKHTELAAPAPIDEAAAPTLVAESAPTLVAPPRASVELAAAPAPTAMLVEPTTARSHSSAHGPWGALAIVAGLAVLAAVALLLLR